MSAKSIIKQVKYFSKCVARTADIEEPNVNRLVDALEHVGSNIVPLIYKYVNLPIFIEELEIKNH